jgi:hypothetical protein
LKAGFRNLTQIQKSLGFKTSGPQPDPESDVIVRHVREADPAGQICDRWQVFVGRNKRSETANPQAALMFARLLADLNKRPVWVGHDPDGPLERFDPSSIRGCSCC